MCELPHQTLSPGSGDSAQKGGNFSSLPKNPRSDHEPPVSERDEAADRARTYQPGWIAGRQYEMELNAPTGSAVVRELNREATAAARVGNHEYRVHSIVWLSDWGGRCVSRSLLCHSRREDR